MSILNNYKQWNPLLILSKKNIWDFVLNKNHESEFFVDGLKKQNLSTYIDINNDECIGKNNILLSKNDCVWEEASSYDAQLNNIGLTGVDNGFIHFRRDKITNKDYINLLTNSKWSNKDNDLRLKLYPVNSNTTTYSFKYEMCNDVGGRFLKLNGGFFQGFIKSESTNYHVLPVKLNESWSLEFNIRPMDYDENFNNLNCIHPENKGIFFYLGVRSENKFLQLYDTDLSQYKIRNIENDNQFICDKFYEGYLDNSNKDYLINDEYLMSDINQLKLKLKDENGINYSQNGYYEIKTDNKFLFFNNTNDGLNSETWNNDSDIILTGITSNSNLNLFLYLNNTKTGYTTNNINTILKENNYKIKDIENDITNNAFALKINEDGSIGYRYLVDSCENENGFEVIEEKSLPKIVKKGEWNVINVCLENVTKSQNICDNNLKNEKMKLKFYVNAKLKFISKELPMLKMRKLDELNHRQEGIAYNISLGGGTMGLSDSIWLDYYNPFKYVLPIEEYFAGTFNGDIKSFKFYSKKLNYNEIKNNYKFELSL